MLAFLSGKKTYILAAAVTAYALFGWWMGYIEQAEALRLVMESGFGATIRNAIKGDTAKVTEAVEAK